MNAIKHAAAQSLTSVPGVEPGTGTVPARAGVALDLPAPAHGDARPRHVHHVRDFGIGYGNSSGYGRVLHFIAAPADPLFRVR